MIRMVRKLRNLTLVQMGQEMSISEKTLSKIECGHIEFTPLYQDKFKAACQKLNVSRVEMMGLRLLLEVRRNENVK